MTSQPSAKTTRALASGVAAFYVLDAGDCPDYFFPITTAVPYAKISCI